MPEPHAVVNRHGVERLVVGHVWISRGDVRRVSAQPGVIVRLIDESGLFPGRACFSDRSQITLRLLAREDVPVNRGFFLDCIRRAAAFRQ